MPTAGQLQFLTSCLTVVKKRASRLFSAMKIRIPTGDFFFADQIFNGILLFGHLIFDLHCKFLKKGLKSEPKGSKIRTIQEIYDFLFT